MLRFLFVLVLCSAYLHAESHAPEKSKPFSEPSVSIDSELKAWLEDPVYSENWNSHLDIKLSGKGLTEQLKSVSQLVAELERAGIEFSFGNFSQSGQGKYLSHGLSMYIRKGEFRKLVKDVPQVIKDIQGGPIFMDEESLDKVRKVLRALELGDLTERGAMKGLQNVVDSENPFEFERIYAAALIQSLDREIDIKDLALQARYGVMRGESSYKQLLPLGEVPSKEEGVVWAKTAQIGIGSEARQEWVKLKQEADAIDYLMSRSHQIEGAHPTGWEYVRKEGTPDWDPRFSLKVVEK